MILGVMVGLQAWAGEGIRIRGVLKAKPKSLGGANTGQGVQSMGVEKSPGAPAP